MLSIPADKLFEQLSVPILFCCNFLADLAQAQNSIRYMMGIAISNREKSLNERAFPSIAPNSKRMVRRRSIPRSLIALINASDPEVAVFGCSMAWRCFSNCFLHQRFDDATHLQHEDEITIARCAQKTHGASGQLQMCFDVGHISLDASVKFRVVHLGVCIRHRRVSLRASLRALAARCRDPHPRQFDHHAIRAMALKGAKPMRA